MLKKNSKSPYNWSTYPYISYDRKENLKGQTPQYIPFNNEGFSVFNTGQISMVFHQ